MTLQEKRDLISQEIQSDLNNTIAELQSIEDELTVQRALRDEAKSQGDLSENAAYTAACSELALLESRKVTTTNRRKALAEANIQYEPSGYAAIGSMVHVATVDGAIDKSFLLTIHELGNAQSCRVSVNSEVGKAVIGHKVGDNFVIKTQAKTLHYRILEVL